MTLIFYFVITKRSQHQQLIILQLWKSEIQKVGHTGLKLRSQHGFVPSSGPGRIYFFFPFLHLQSQMSSIFKSFSDLNLLFCFPLSLIRAIVITLGLLEQSNVIFLFPDQRISILNFVCNLNSPMPSNITLSQPLGIRTQSYVGGHHSAYHASLPKVT